MGILNIGPDSFYDGGKYDTLASARARCAAMLDEGADIIDIGAESTRPGARPLDPEMELHALKSVLPALVTDFPEAVFSVDTRNARTAVYALENGATIINDISACQHDPELERVLAEYKPAYILTHNEAGADNTLNLPDHVNLDDHIVAWFEKRLNALVQAGLPENHVVLDPGIGFGKNAGQTIRLLAHIGKLAIFRRPVLAGLSMKSFFGKLLGHLPDERGLDTALSSALLWQKGVFWHRVHNVAETLSALELASLLQEYAT